MFINVFYYCGEKWGVLNSTKENKLFLNNLRIGGPISENLFWETCKFNTFTRPYGQDSKPNQFGLNSNPARPSPVIIYLGNRPA